jgi:hypothetical protein
MHSVLLDIQMHGLDISNLMWRACRCVVDAAFALSISVLLSNGTVKSMHMSQLILRYTARYLRVHAVSQYHKHLPLILLLVLCHTQPIVLEAVQPGCCTTLSPCCTCHLLHLLHLPYASHDCCNSA